MIVSIESSLSTFKAVHFQEGLNVLLADTRPGSTEKQTRNSAGKTSLVEIIHFLMGSNCDKDSLFRTPGLIEHTFTGSFMIAGETFTVQRGGSEPAKIFLLSGGEVRDDFPKRTDKRAAASLSAIPIGASSWVTPCLECRLMSKAPLSKIPARQAFAHCSLTSRAGAIPARSCIRNVRRSSSSEETGRSTFLTF